MAKLSDVDIDARLAQLTGWGRQGDEIAREYTFGDFMEALGFVNAVAELAEAADHHPDILIHGYKRVKLTLSTHSEGGLTGRDFDLAARIDASPAGKAGE
jgi:4a-hydroxytetrahydrobiopterin dehydratase